MTNIRRDIPLYLILFQLLFVNSINCLASQASSLHPGGVIEIAENYDYIFIGTVTNKTLESDSTNYVFNVSEYLKHPLNTTEVYLTVGGGSEIAVSPSTSFFLGIEYVFFFDEIDEYYRIVGHDYTFTLLNSVDSEVIENIRKIQNARARAGDPVSYTHLTLPTILLV